MTGCGVFYFVGGLLCIGICKRSRQRRWVRTVWGNKAGRGPRGKASGRNTAVVDLSNAASPSFRAATALERFPCPCACVHGAGP